MAVPSEKMVTLNHGTTRYLEQGEGDPVILLHGVAVAGGADDWRPALEFLGTDHRFLAPDFLTFPPGDTKENLDAFPYLTDFVREFQDALDIKKSHIVGATMGGWIAGLFGYESTQRVDKLVMTGNPGFHGAGNNRLSSFQAPDAVAVRLAIDKVAGMLSEGERKKIAAAKSARLSEPGYAEAHGTMMKTMADPAKRERFNLRRRLPAITVPTLLVLGRGDPTSEQAEELRKMLPLAQVVIVEDGSHQVHYENADQFASAVLSFIG
jgi:pimeloyl-ACP methyl ester carboxylesterase